MANTEHFKDASWITLPDEPTCGRGITTAYFRLKFHLAAPASCAIRISASSRYRLWVNGKSAAFGPCKGDRWRHYYETVDIAGYLAPGWNVLAVKVVAYPPYEAERGGDRGPSWTMARALGPCLIVDGQCMDEAGDPVCGLTTGFAGWESCLDGAIQWQLFPLSHWMGSMEQVCGERVPKGWKCRDASGGDWKPAKPLWKADDPSLSIFGIIPVFPLVPRPIPLLYEEEKEFQREMPLRSGDVEPFSFSGFMSPAIIPPHARMAVELDAGELTTGSITLTLSGGRGARVSIRYAESYSRQEDGHRRKGRRDDWEHYELYGHEDTYFPSGGEDSYEPFWFRAFRFVRIEAETAEEALTIGLPAYTETGYPLEAISSVESPEAWVGKLWGISVRTLKRCMHETYEDCPYYEQLQYIQDTRLEMLFTYMVSGDTRLAKRAIEDFHASLLPDGMLQARYPTQEPLVIPPFSLHWIFMLTEYYEQTGDASLPRRYRPTVDAVLDWYDRKIGRYGLVENLGYWDQIDWVDQWDHIAGRTPAGEVGPATTHNLMYAAALQAGAAVNRITGREGVALEYEARAEAVLGGVEKHCWSEKEQLYMEGPCYEEYSQHAQVYAVLTGLAGGEKAKGILLRALDKEGIALCSFTWQFFLFRAFEKCGAYELTERQWPMWKALLDRNLTTIPEIPDGAFSPRSECHAWGALPLYEFTRCILGVNPASPGWGGILVRPRPLSLPGASGSVVTPRGVVQVQWVNGENGFGIRIDSPEGVPVTLMLPCGNSLPFPHGGAIKAGLNF